MNNKMKDEMRKIIARIPKQNVYEIICALAPLEKELGFTITNYYLLFSNEGLESCPIPLDHIHATMVTNTHLCILCENDVIHCFDRRIGKHEVIFPESDKPNFWEMFLMMCRSYLTP